MVILVTGATGGICEKLIIKLAVNHSIIAVARNVGRLKKLKNTVGKNLEIKSINVSKPNQVMKLFASISKIDAIINAAAVLNPIGKFTKNNLNQWKENIDINLLGTVYICYFGIPLLLKSKKGKIINFAGGGSAYPRPKHSAYATSKTAVVRFSEIIAKEFPSLDINVIAPGIYKTKMWKDEIYDKEPKKWGDINQLLLFFEFLLSEKSNGITGKFIHYKDHWEKFDKKIPGKDLFTLRRIEK